jgi:UDP-N-acetylmuramoyl-L-alanyl-D-glutamate--2,6-diaminopimelate ligase
MDPWTLPALVRAAGLQAQISGDAVVEGLSYDPVQARAGDLFCCIRGERADGHDFARDVAGRGAVALLVERNLELNLAQARVQSVREAMPPLAAAFFHHPSAELAVAAVTGTNGKTTVSYLLESIAVAAGSEPGVVGTVTRRFKGVEEKAGRSTPEAIDLQRLLRTMRDAGVDIVVIEATSDGLEQGRLRGTRVATAGFTNLTQDHLNTHGTMDAYFRAKASLFDPQYTERAVINIADDYGRRLYESVRKALAVTTYGSDAADIACVSAELGATGSRARLRTPAGDIDITTPLVGRYNIDNCMCATGMALQLGISSSAIVNGIARLTRVAGRLEPVEAGQPFLALVDYAHTPDALEQALHACRELARDGHVIVVFGCGGDRDRAKRPLMGEVATRLADHAIVTSDNPRTEDPLRIIADIEAGAQRGGDFSVVPDRREAIAAALGRATSGDVVLVAGKGHEQGQEIGDRVIPFDDREVVKELLAEATCRS